MQLTKGAIGNLINRYKAVLKKCHLMNTFGSLAVAGMLVMGGAGVAGANTIAHIADLLPYCYLHVLALYVQCTSEDTSKSGSRCL